MYNIPLKTTLEVARDRLKSFMDTYGASLQECAKVMGLRDHQELKKFMKTKSAVHCYTEAVIAEFGADGVDRAKEKLESLRGCEVVAKPVVAKPGQPKSQDATTAFAVINTLDGFMAKHNLTSKQASKALGFSPSYISLVKRNAKLGQLGKKAISNIMQRIREYQPEPCQNKPLQKPVVAPENKPMASDACLTDMMSKIPELAVLVAAKKNGLKVKILVG